MRILNTRRHPVSLHGRGRRGSVLLEAALVLPVLLTLVFGTIEFGWAFYVKHQLQGAAREGARRAIVADATNAKVRSAVSDALITGGLADITYTVSICDSKTGGDVDVSSVETGDAVLVEVSAPWSQFSVFLSGFGDFLDGDLIGRTVMRREG